MSSSEPRLLLVGPARLLHMAVDRKGPITVFRVPRRDGTAADCVGAPGTADAVVELAHASLDIPEDEAVCATGDRRVWLSWHARRPTDAGTGAAPQGPTHASLFPER